MMIKLQWVAPLAVVVRAGGASCDWGCMSLQEVYDQLVAREKAVRAAEAGLADAEAEGLARLRQREDEIEASLRSRETRLTRQVRRETIPNTMALKGIHVCAVKIFWSFETLASNHCKTKCLHHQNPSCDIIEPSQHAGDGLPKKEAIRKWPLQGRKLTAWLKNFID